MRRAPFSFVHRKLSGEEVRIQVLDVDRSSVLYGVFRCEASPMRVELSSFTACFGRAVLAA